MNELEDKLKNIKQILRDFGVEANGKFYNYYIFPRITTEDIENLAILDIYNDGKIEDYVRIENEDDLRQNWYKYWDNVWGLDASTGSYSDYTS
jgi:hypothetical protein